MSRTRALQAISEVPNGVVAALADYPGKAPVMQYELNAWLDRKLGFKSMHLKTSHIDEPWRFADEYQNPLGLLDIQSLQTSG